MWQRHWAGGLLMAALLLVAFVTARVHAAEVVDRIVAVVGHQIILQSELDAQLAMQAAQAKLDLSDSAKAAEAREALLDQMVQDRLMLIEAERDTSLKVADRDVEKELDNHLARVQSQFPSPEDFYKQLAAEGLTLPELRRRYRDEVRNQLLKQKLIEKKVRTVEVSPPEVADFYQRYKDSLPDQPPMIHIAQILFPIPLSDATLDSVRAIGEVLLDSLQAGVRFAELAMRYSDDGSASSGGDLGWFGRGVMLPAFEKAAFGLASGQTSGLVQTRYGFHIIRSIERSQDRVHVAHILLRTLPSEEDLRRARAVADSVSEAIENGADFAALAKRYSIDSTTAAQGGDLGRVPVDALQEPFASAISGHPGTGLLAPVAADDGLHLIDILGREESRPYDPQKDRQALTEMARREKTGRIVEEWVKELRDKIYVEVRL